MAAAAPVLSEALDRCRRGFCLLLVLSCGINLLMLTAPLFMLQLFDRVVTSRSTDTLIFLTAIAGVALLAMALLEMVRGDVLTRIGSWLEQTLSAPILRRSLDTAQAAGPAGSA